jgi:LuxR family transcriptional regulator, maltose regulon positive regulatory protein
MATPILQTKLHIPVLRSNLVRRPRLIEQLKAGVEKRLVLISAPAGYGKTTLIVEWLMETKLPTAWLSLDEGDNDPVRFFYYLVSSIRTILPDVGTSSLFMLQSPQKPVLEALLSLLINDLTGVPDHFVLVLDDYHVLHDQHIHGMVTFLLDHLPVQMHLVIGTRADPPLPVARLRGRGQLIEIRLSDLRFNMDEASDFFHQTLAFSLEERALVSLVTRAEGWAAGLQLVAVAVQGQVSDQGKEALPGFVRSFTGSNRYILDYLMEEVLQQQPIEIQDFLQQTCILERFCAPLCNALLEGERFSAAPQASAFILEYLDRSNLFLVPLDDQRYWYRYHHLFSDLLNQRLVQSQPGLIPVLHRRASTWFEQNGYMSEAIEHTLEAGDAERAAMLIAQAAEPALMHGEVITYMHWVERLPESILMRQPRLIVYQAWGLLFAGTSKEKIETSLSSLAESPLTAPIRGYMALFQGEIQLAIELLQQALEQLPEEEHFLRGLAAICLANAYLSEYEVTTGVSTLEEVAQESQRTGNLMLAVLVCSVLAELSRKLGQLHKAEKFYQQALELAKDEQGKRLPVASRPLAGLGDLRREWDDLEAAEKDLNESIALSQNWMRAGFLYSAPPMIRVKMARREWEEAQEIIDQARKAAAEFSITQIDDYLVEMYQAWLWVSQGKNREAARWVENFHVSDSIETITESGAEAYNLFHIRKYEQLILVRLYLAQDEPDEALRLLESLLPKFEKIGRMVQVIEIKILCARALHALGRNDEALSELRNALILAEPEGYIRLFVDEGDEVQRMLRRVQTGEKALQDYIQRLVAAFSIGQPSAAHSSVSSEHEASLPLTFEPLSQRESDVLSFLPSPLSTEEIADQLVVSVHTVRSHIKSIYSKLDVHSRLEAVEKAKALKIL